MTPVFINTLSHRGMSHLNCFINDGPPTIRRMSHMGHHIWWIIGSVLSGLQVVTRDQQGYHFSQPKQPASVGFLPVTHATHRQLIFCNICVTHKLNTNAVIEV